MHQVPPENDINVSSAHLIDEAARLLLCSKSEPDNQIIKSEIAIWQNQSARHAHSWETAQKVWLLTGQLSNIPANDYIAQPKDKISNTLKPHASLSRRQLMGGAIAACTIIAALPTANYYIKSDYRTGIGQNKNINLADGTKVVLDTNTSISLNYDGEKRGIGLNSGRVWLNVAKDPKRPFKINANDIVITVLGTQFDVSRRDNITEVNLAEGSVKIEYKDAGINNTIIMKPGDCFRYDNKYKQSTLTTAPVNEIAAWRHGRIIANGETIAAIAQKIQPYFMGKIIISDKAFAMKKVTGNYDIKNPIDAVVALAAAHKGRVRRVSPFVLVVSAT